jgi:hypothetical protein
MPALVAATALVFAIACHAALRRIPKAPGAVAAFLIVGILIGGAVTTLLWLSPLAWDEFLAALIVYAALSALYLFLFTLALGSITANILVALSHGTTDVTDLAARYDGRRMVSNRVETNQGARRYPCPDGARYRADDAFPAARRVLRAPAAGVARAAGDSPDRSGL